MPTDFETFKAECYRLQREMGLLDWSIHVLESTGKDPEVNEAEDKAWVYADPEAGSATIYWSKGYQGPPARCPRRCAGHEMAHVLTAELKFLASERYMTDARLCDADELIARRIENLLYGQLISGKTTKRKPKK